MCIFKKTFYSFFLFTISIPKKAACKAFLKKFLLFSLFFAYVFSHMKCSVYLNQTLVCFWPSGIQSLRCGPKQPETIELSERLDCNSIPSKMVYFGHVLQLRAAKQSHATQTERTEDSAGALQKCAAFGISGQIDKKRKMKTGSGLCNYLILYLAWSLCSLCTWQRFVHGDIYRERQMNEWMNSRSMFWAPHIMCSVTPTWNIQQTNLASKLIGVKAPFNGNCLPWLRDWRQWQSNAYLIFCCTVLL